MNHKLVCGLTGAGFVVLASAGILAPEQAVQSRALESTDLLHLAIGTVSLGFAFARVSAARLFAIVFDLWYGAAASLGSSACVGQASGPGWNAVCLVGLAVAVVCGLSRIVEPVNTKLPPRIS